MPDKQQIMACKLVHGVTVQGHHDSYVMCTDSQKVTWSPLCSMPLTQSLILKDMEEWLCALRANISSSPFYEMIQKHKERSSQAKRTASVPPRPKSLHSSTRGRQSSKKPLQPEPSESFRTTQASQSDPPQEETAPPIEWRTLHSIGMMCATVRRLNDIYD
jgi:hypothetical protein